jgi:hypothetical protein
MPTTKFRLALALGGSLSLLLLAACSGDGGNGDEAQPGASASTGASGTPVAGACGNAVLAEPIDGNLLPLVLSSDLALGHNRFVVAVIDQEASRPVTDADLHLTFVCFDSKEGTPVFESDPEPITLMKTYTHTHEDGTVETHEAGESGTYVSYVDFDRAGTWGIDVTGKAADGQDIGPARLTFSVGVKAAGLAAGDPAPQSKQPILSDVADIREIDTSEFPIPEQHNMTIADAVASGKPTVIAFATPAFCQSQVCGPVKEIFDDLYNAYKDRANFVHIEPYDVNKMREGSCSSLAACLAPTVNEWKLQNEPWVFVVGADGKIAAKFDGIASYDEMETALKAALDD